MAESLGDSDSTSSALEDCPKVSEAEVEVVASSLSRIENWCKRNNVAVSALGRAVCQDQSLVSRWRASGQGGVSHNKRIQLARYILEHPDGIPNYKRGLHRGKQARFAPNKTDRMPLSTGPSPSQTLPVPALSALEKASDVEWVRKKAMERRVPLVIILAEMVSLGIMVAKDTEAEENRT